MCENGGGHSTAAGRDFFLQLVPNYGQFSLITRIGGPLLIHRRRAPAYFSNSSWRREDEVLCRHLRPRWNLNEQTNVLIDGRDPSPRGPLRSSAYLMSSGGSVIVTTKILLNRHISRLAHGAAVNEINPDLRWRRPVRSGFSPGTTANRAYRTIAPTAMHVILVGRGRVSRPLHRLRRNCPPLRRKPRARLPNG